jgi:membrane protease YdiL (CAAX protease family)
MNKSHFKFKWIMRGIIFALIFIALFSLILMLIWNSVMPQIFNLKQLTYLQAAGLLILSKILFFGVGRRSSGSFHDKREFFRKKFEERYGKETGKNDFSTAEQK